MHFGLASIKHRTNSFKVVVNIFFSLYHLHHLPLRVSYMYKYLACVAFHRYFSCYALIDRRFLSYCFFSSSKIPYILLVLALGNHDCVVRVFFTSKCLSEQVILYFYVGFSNSHLLLRELYTIFLLRSPFGF